jgi:hypothetical protein
MRNYKVVYKQAKTGLWKWAFMVGGYNAARYAEKLVGLGHTCIQVREIA